MDKAERLRLHIRTDEAAFLESMIAAGRHYASRPGRSKRGRRFIWFWSLTGTGLLLLFLGFDFVAGRRFGVIEFVFGALFGVLVYWWIIAGAQRRIAAATLQSPLYDGGIDIELDREGLTMRTKMSHTFIRWPAVDALLELRHGLGIALSGQLLAIPDQALPTGMDRTALRGRIELWRDGAA